MFFWNSCFLDDPADVDNLISGSSAFSKTSLNIWKFTVHVLLKPGLENFEYYFTSVWDECNCAVVWAFKTPILWPPHAKSWLIGKDSGAGRDWGQEEKGTTEDEMAGWHHQLHGHEFEWTPGVGDGQEGLVCCDSWGCKETDTTERMN